MECFDTIYLSVNILILFKHYFINTLTKVVYLFVLNKDFINWEKYQVINALEKEE